MRTAFACLLSLAFAVSAIAEEAPAWRGLRADIKASDAVLRIRIGGSKAAEGDASGETEISAVVERVFKGEGTKAGEDISLRQATAEYLDRLAGELDCPGGLAADGIRFFSKVPAAGSSCVVFARRQDGKLLLDTCCLAEPAGGLSFTSAEQAKAYGEERERSAKLADGLVARCVAAAGLSDTDAAVEYTLALCEFFAPEGNGDAELAVGAILDDWRRLRNALPAGNPKVAASLSKALDGWLVDGGPTTNAASNLRTWLIERLPESERKRLMPRLVAEFRAARAKVEELQKRMKDPKKNKGDGEAEMRERMQAPAAFATAQEFVRRTLDPANPPNDLDSDELLMKAEEFCGK